MNTPSQLHEEFSERVIRVWGGDGQQWVEMFPKTLAHFIDAWELEEITPIPNLSYNFVASAETQSGQPVILKLGVPNPELTTEAAALRVYNGHGSVRLISADLEKGALLLEKLNPGRMLHKLGDNQQEAAIAAQVMAQVCVLPPEDHHFPSLTDWTKVFERVLTNHQPVTAGLSVRLIETAQFLADEMNQTATDQWLLHGDLHHFNILEDHTRGWTAIDPKGVIGDKAFQAARFFSNPIPDFLSHPDLLELTRQRTEIFSRELEIPPERLIKWAYVDCILSASWCIEDHEEVGVPYAVSIAEMFARMINI